MTNQKTVLTDEMRSNLFFVCSLIEEIGRQLKLPRSSVVKLLGRRTLRQLLKDADILHCEPIAKVADDYIEMLDLPKGDYDNLKNAQYQIPDVWTIGQVYARLVEDISSGDLAADLQRVYGKWTDRYLSDYNLPIYWQPRDYIAVCFQEKKIY